MPNFNMKDILKYAIKNLVDELNRLIFIIFLCLFIVTIFIRNFYLDATKFILLIIFIYRLVSKNKEARRKENTCYLNIKDKILHPFSSNAKAKEKDVVYKRCSNCKTILKLPLPKKLGINHAKCPNCSKRLTIISLRKKRPEKVRVEVIKKKRGS